jgi:hypothetical protein
MNQIRPPEGGKWYSPDRDLAHNFPALFMEMVRKYRNRSWPELEDVISACGLSDREIDEAISCYADYIGGAVSKDGKPLTMLESLTDSGFLARSPAAQVCVFAMVGLVMSSAQFTAARDATIGGEGPLLDMQKFVEESKKMSYYYSRPRWLRKVIAVCNGLNFWRGLR